MKQITQDLLKLISDPTVGFSGAYNIREDSSCAGRISTDNIKIINNRNNDGIEIHIAANTVGETVFIPAVVTRSAIMDKVHNDFYIGENSDIIIMAGCGVHSDGEGDASHDGVHRFFVGKNAKVKYLENHIGTGNGRGKRAINPVTEVVIEENGYMLMETSQLSGVNYTKRETIARVESGGSFVVKEALMTDNNDYCTTDFDVDLDGTGSGTHLVSRSVAKGKSNQIFTMKINGNAESHGHAECDAIIMGNGVVTALPGLVANHPEAALIHEAAIGKIAGEQIIKLMTLGLTEEEAENKIIEGFLS